MTVFSRSHVGNLEEGGTTPGTRGHIGRLSTVEITIKDDITPRIGKGIKRGSSWTYIEKIKARNERRKKTRAHRRKKEEEELLFLTKVFLKVCAH